MALKSNNFEVEGLRCFFERVKRGEDDPRKSFSVKVEWVLWRGLPQIRAEVAGERMSMLIESELPSFLGGKGTRPPPINYFLYGLAASFLSTFVALVSVKEITLRKIWAEVSCDVDYGKLLGIGVNPPLEKITIDLNVEAQASEEDIEGLIEEAEEACPAFSALDKSKVKVNLLFTKVEGEQAS